MISQKQRSRWGNGVKPQPVDPDLAEHMGAFEERAVNPDDLDDMSSREEDHERTF